MGLSARFAAAAVRRPCVLLVPVPGHAPLRRAAEDALDARGWAQAASPAAADLLVECGPVGPGLAPAVEVAWSGLPGPRVRVRLGGITAVGADLASGTVLLRDVVGQQQDARNRPAPALSAADGGDMDGMDMGGGDRDGMDIDGDMDGMDMAMDLPGGLMMADRVADRDGLRLEGLHLSLGPLLPAWPAGLQLDVVLSGDVLTSAEVHRLDPQAEPDAPVRVRALDALALLLQAAGWEDGARRARRARAEGGRGPATDDLLRRLRRARLLRWSLRHLPGPAGQDLAAHLDRLTHAVTDEVALPGSSDDELAGAVTGLDVGTAALVVSVLGPLVVPETACA